MQEIFGIFPGPAKDLLNKCEGDMNKLVPVYNKMYNKNKRGAHDAPCPANSHCLCCPPA